MKLFATLEYPECRGKKLPLQFQRYRLPEQTLEMLADTRNEEPRSCQSEATENHTCHSNHPKKYLKITGRQARHREIKRESGHQLKISVSQYPGDVGCGRCSQEARGERANVGQQSCVTHRTRCTAERRWIEGSRGKASAAPKARWLS